MRRTAPDGPGALRRSGRAVRHASATPLRTNKRPGAPLAFTGTAPPWRPTCKFSIRWKCRKRAPRSPARAVRRARDTAQSAVPLQGEAAPRAGRPRGGRQRCRSGRGDRKPAGGPLSIDVFRCPFVTGSSPGSVTRDDGRGRRSVPNGDRNAGAAEPNQSTHGARRAAADDVDDAREEASRDVSAGLFTHRPTDRSVMKRGGGPGGATA